MNFEKNKDMIHTIIEGPPGVGKTTLGYIIGEIYANLDIIEQPKQNNNVTSKNNQLKFKIVKRADLIAKYLGQTSHRTQQVIDSVLGGVLFIDEAYSLGNNEVDDSYSKECLDTLNQNLSEKKNQFLCIIAGYKDALDKNFFAYNEGLRRRFPFTYTIEEYSPNELKQIFLGMLSETKWGLEGYIEKEIIHNTKNKIELNIVEKKQNVGKNKIENIIEKKESEEVIIKKELDKIETNIIEKKVININKEDKLLQFFEKNKLYFPNFGGDIEIFIFQTKIEHCKRVFFEDEKYHKILTLEDINNGLEILKKNKKIIKEDYKMLSMYL
jgi:DNA polymerase III delta prime subunit